LDCTRDPTCAAAAAATWALVCAQGDVLGSVAALRSRDARRFLMRSCLAESVGMLVGVNSLCTLGTDGCTSMERVIILVSSVWVAGTLGGSCTLGTRGMLGVCICQSWHAPGPHIPLGLTAFCCSQTVR